MESLISLIKKAQEKDATAMETIIQKYTPKIQKSLWQTSNQDRNDLKQEVNLKMIEAVYKYDLETVPGFWDLMDIEEKKKLDRLTNMKKSVVKKSIS
ncbi:helix-turn-helix domain-containing protein [Paenibacillus glucanolyticus]|jgi:DNA-directed RNA polymerase specialized sigma subunit|uniref:Helix-turn-helix conjugative transposon-like domain-containing protein n=1 Tax=Paenibacillus glucanolyticus TaxID=59843 RepID=A0A163GJU8_9BACL|nr:helix-turn-helix domain-containing protein [Paenibacillus glucanolyticus]KZS45012.1 hypothetical protein AWU65_03255 [Paenibacillus glucanolyticus]OMF66751.1 hypothetical protein BK142_29460 [Paenibacillus glucanolyticus]